MTELVFCKLGGSIITDKRVASTPRLATIRRLAGEIRAALDQRPALRLLLGHGSGSFGHVVAARYDIRHGIADGQSWWGFAETGAIAAQLNRIVTDTFIAAGVPVVSVQPSASARCRKGQLLVLEDHPIREALRRGLVPLIYGDVAFDDEQGCTIVSTEDEFAYLAERLHPTRIVMVGEVDGVYDGDPQADPSARQIPRITPDTLAQVEAKLKGSHATDVTGGMSSKVHEMVRLVARGYTERVHMISGTEENVLTRVLVDAHATDGTTITGDRCSTERNMG